MAWLDEYRSSLMGTVTNPLALLDRGEGCYVWDSDGKKYLDFLAGIAVNSLGHAHPTLVKAISDQAGKLVHVSNYFATASQIALAERLCAITGAGAAGRVLFGNSGAEAMEAAFKLARLNGGVKKPRILTLKNSFHGRTMGSLTLTGQPALHEGFEPLVPNVEYMDSNIQALEQAIGPDVAALIVEPIKGEAGVFELPDGYLESARALTESVGALLILDEIQTGIGRTGTWFAFQKSGIKPDAVAVAKGLAGGFPIGALVTFGKASELFQPGGHGSTFGGNPLATSVAMAVLEEIEHSGLIENASLRGRQIREFLSTMDHPLISEVRGSGLLIGVGLTAPVAKALASSALERGLIINAPKDHSIRICPPLIVGETEIESFKILFLEALESVKCPAIFFEMMT